MNQRDLSAVKRRLNPEERYPSVIRGCYMASDGTVMSSFTKPVGTLPQEEFEKYAGIFRKVLSGTQGQNLLPVDFSAAQTMEDEAHQLLMELCRTELQDDGTADGMFAQIRAGLLERHDVAGQSVQEHQQADNRLILLMYDCMDLPHRRGDGEDDMERSENVFNYILCAVCPVKPTKPSLSWFSAENDFHARPEDWTVGQPESGFMFPALVEGGADLYSALFYTRSADEQHEGLMRHVFHTDTVMPAAQQRDAFQAVLETSLAEECSLGVVQTLHEKVSEMMEAQKKDKMAEPLSLTRSEVRTMLTDSGVSEARAEAFDASFQQTFGAYAEVPAVNLITPRQYKVATPDVSISVAPDKRDLVETRVIDGHRYILILAEGDVTVNGVNIMFS